MMNHHLANQADFDVDTPAACAFLLPAALIFRNVGSLDVAEQQLAEKRLEMLPGALMNPACAVCPVGLA
jgi:hypothetical protein